MKKKFGQVGRYLLDIELSFTFLKIEITIMN